jgi:2-keto-4-pentenoate hydratase/2-oxohepta-3-ene-1,7-dioic acid hydratase in catechol pathway
MFPPEGAAWGRAEIGGRALGVVRDGEFLVTQSGERHARSAARLLPPVLPFNFYAAGLNYRSHIDWVNREHGGIYKVPTQSDIGTRAPSALVGSGADLVIPADSPGPVHYEGELVAVIGRSARGLAEQDALSCVAGYTLGNDVSERSWQRSDRTLWRAKNCDTFKPMGPWIETDFDMAAARTKVRLNGHECIDFKTDAMIHGVVDYLVAISRYMTLEPGDVLWMGTEGHAEQMKPGDVVEVEITGIGTLRNPVVAAR